MILVERAPIAVLIQIGLVLLAVACDSAQRTSVDTIQLPSIPAAAPTDQVSPDTVVGLRLRRTMGFGLAAAESLFKAAGPARDADLTGTWFQVRHVIARSGAGRPEIIYLVDSLRGADSTSQEGWTLQFPGGSRFIANVGGGPDKLDLQFDSRGDLLFAPDFAADNSPTYNCRALAVSHLICFDTEHREEAFEFEKRVGGSSHDAQ